MSTQAAAADTIAAIASPPGRGLRGLIRVSGARARALVQATWCGSAAPALERRGVLAGSFRDARGEQPLLLLWMPAPHSFTREDVAEFHLPGAPALLEAAYARLLELGARAARPGEFTRRAFLAGRIDLARAEGVLALVSAEDEHERRASAGLFFGGLSRRVAALRDELDVLRAMCEASLDFDENDTGHVQAAELLALRDALLAGLSDALAWEIRRASARGELRIVLAGLPNAGKSALFNALAGAERALVSPHAGTTRDVLEAEIELCGSACRLIDSAGLDAAASGVALQAQQRANEARQAADLVLWVVDSTRAEDFERQRSRAALSEATPSLVVWNKIDAAGAAPAPCSATCVAVSALTGQGLDELRAAMARRLALDPGPDQVAGPAHSAGLGRELAVRHRQALLRARSEVEQGFEAWCAGEALELLAERLRTASAALDEISGATTAEALLDRIFARFCLGK